MVNVQYPVEFDTMIGYSTDCEYRRHPDVRVACSLIDYDLNVACDAGVCPLRPQMSVPYCRECGKVRPESSTAHDCVPCANAGHLHSLVMDDADRIQRIALWEPFYEWQDYRTRRDSIPGWKRLLSPPLGARKFDGWAGDDLQDRIDDVYAHRAEVQA